jgi:hypothetical protein
MLNSLIPVIEFAAVFACTIFAGAAVYVTFVEHPARLTCSTECALSQWAPSYKRATVMQASLAIVATIAGLVAFWLGAGAGWLVGAAVIFSVVPITFLVIMPTNRLLLDPTRDRASSATRELLVRWGHLHAIRSVVGVIASLMMWRLLLGA